MATKTFNTKFGLITLRNAMLEERDGTTLYEGLEMKDEDGERFEIPGYKNLEEISIEEVEQIYEEQTF